jgi:hypothetical protein
MATPGPSPTQEVWFKLLKDAEIARNYQAIGVVTQPWVPRSPNPILDSLIPSLLYMRVGSIIDEAFEEYIESNDLTMGRAYREDFNGRTRFLADQNRLNDSTRVHGIRTRRNELAHEAKASCDWPELDGAIESAHVELQHLGLVGPRPQYSFFFERTPRSISFEPTTIINDYRYGLKEGDRLVVEVAWSYQFGAPTVRPPE